ncbi:MAG: fibronectin type III domain-containing protein, partial [Clostridiales Family XIII bacterium]|nr:fibronectin type III domain-containing protein [Clostridiales Family XIII bacterium]
MRIATKGIAAIVILLGMLGLLGCGTSIEAPIGLDAAPEGTHTVVISWTAVDGAESYTVSLTATTSAPITRSTEETEIVFDDLKSGTTYSVSVVSAKKNNEIISEPAITKFTTGSPVVEDIAGINAEAISDTEIYVSWDASVLPEGEEGIVSYVVEGTEALTEDFTVLTEKPIDTPAFTHSGLPGSSLYFYRVHAILTIDDTDYVSQNSETVYAVTAVSGLTAETKSDSEITLSWNAATLPEDADRSVYYILEGSDAEDGVFAALQEDPIFEASYARTGLKGSTTEYYRVRAVVAIDEVTYTSIDSNIVSATTDKTPEPVARAASSGVGSITDAQYAESLSIAQSIASSIPPASDLQRVQMAASIVSGYYQSGVHKESGPYYNTPYGVFVAGESSCAGCTRALGMVLSCMGYSWEHVNPNSWTHQWCRLTMDGQVGFADGQVGWAGYGPHPVE